jgi:SanA protein
MSASTKKNCRRLFVAVAVLFVVSLTINIFIIYSTEDRIFNQIKNLPQQDFELVLGTEPVRPDGSTNLHFLNRTAAAAKVFSAGKVKFVLISGSKNNRGFNEVLEMRKKILADGVPESALKLDFDGNRTWESIRRAKESYHLQEAIIITDAFHAPRAILLCKHFGIKAVAYCPGREPFGYWFVRCQVKEYFARLKAVFDILSN